MGLAFAITQVYGDGLLVWFCQPQSDCVVRLIKVDVENKCAFWDNNEVMILGNANWLTRDWEAGNA